jgi:hypothetical protein
METIGSPVNPEDTKLWLPSSLAAGSLSCDIHLLTMEWELRIAQAGDALEEIRRSLRLRNYMYTFKRNWVRGQSANTRAQNALGRVKERAATAAEKYRAAHAALSALAPILRKVGWNVKLRSLNTKDDVREMTVPKQGESEGRRQLSWIWVVEGVGDDEDEVVQDGTVSFCYGRKLIFTRSTGLRIEWCKARARAMRWREEVELLQEEMRRVLQFLRWHACWWDVTAHSRTLPTAAENEGLIAYATRQAQIRRDLAAKFEFSWMRHLSAVPGVSTVSPALSHSVSLHLPDLSIPELPPP